MDLRRWLPILAFAALGAGAIACAADEDLNPQPLPPHGDDDDGTREPTAGGSSGSLSSGSTSGFSGSSGGSSSGSAATPDDLRDAAPADSGDAGDGGDAGPN